MLGSGIRRFDGEAARRAAASRQTRHALARGFDNRMPEPNIGDRNSYGSRVHEFRTAKIAARFRDVCPRPGAAWIVEDYYDFPMGSDF